jgi:hypothetical protein
MKEWAMVPAIGIPKSQAAGVVAEAVKPAR